MVHSAQVPSRQVMLTAVSERENGQAKYFCKYFERQRKKILVIRGRSGEAKDKAEDAPLKGKVCK